MKPIPLLLATALVAGPLGAIAADPHAHHKEKAGGGAGRSAAAPREQTDWGIAGDPKSARRTIRITMSDDMRFTPAIVEVGQGETVKFEIRNAGKMLHEMVIGTPEHLAQHAALMLKHPGMEHDAPYMRHVRPGKSGAIYWTFNRPGEFEFACLLPGHYQAGMVGRIRVIARAGEPGHKH
jgi:uncharacterized cupredoxin-like copper-binding protein